MKAGLKLGGSAADEFFAEVAWRPLNSSGPIDVPPEEGRAMGFEGERFEAIFEAILAAMLLGELLYSVLVGEGSFADEPA